jgi:hypothetical protein
MGLDLNSAPPEEPPRHLQAAPRRWASSATGAQCRGSDAPGPAPTGPCSPAAGEWRHVGSGAVQDQRPAADHGPSSTRYMWQLDGAMPLPAAGPGAVPERPAAAGLFKAEHRTHSAILPHGSSPRAPFRTSAETIQREGGDDCVHAGALGGGAPHPAADDQGGRGAGAECRPQPPPQGPRTGWLHGACAPAVEEGRQRLPGPFLQPHQSEAWHPPSAHPVQEWQPEQELGVQPAAGAWRGQLPGPPSEAGQGGVRCAAH